METVSAAEARKRFSDLMARVTYGGERIVIESRGRPMMAWISVRDLERLADLEKEGEPARTRQAALALAAACRERIRRERSQVPLPDSSEVLARVREERTDELSDLR